MWTFSDVDAKAKKQVLLIYSSKDKSYSKANLSEPTTWTRNKKSPQAGKRWIKIWNLVGYIPLPISTFYKTTSKTRNL